MNTDKPIIIRPNSFQTTYLWIGVLVVPVVLLAVSFISLFVEKSYGRFVFCLVSSVVVGYLLNKVAITEFYF
ncbi:MAG: hypothetical protein FWE85_01990 [Clostridiales bacterium]|nr:hypothetical protein [Clostridiales bacterium]